MPSLLARCGVGSKISRAEILPPTLYTPPATAACPRIHRMAKVGVPEDYYSILEVSPYATLAAIREAYKRLALKCHPDKNTDENATATFQRLGRAWETLKDASKRAEYDRIHVSIPTQESWRPDADPAEPARAKRKREQAAGDENVRWGREPNTAPSESGNGQPPDEVERRKKAKALRTIAQQDYLSRLQTWIDFRKGRIDQIAQYENLIEKYESALDAQGREGEESFIQKFKEAIERSYAAGQNQDREATLAKLIQARRNYTSRLTRDIEEYKDKMGNLIAELEDDKRRYEEEEGRIRRRRIQRALEILGPRDLNPPPLFSTIDRRGKAINAWKALSRLRNPVKFVSSWEARTEGPWHETGEWERVTGEHTCGRCNESAFHLIPECGPAKCPGCGMIACHACYRDLQLLREYSEWVTSPTGDLRDSLFSLEFKSTARVSKH